MAIFRGTGGAGDASGGISINEVTEQATNAAASATSAANSATAASTSAGSAATSASAADTSATSASTSASNAATSASAASTSETNAGASASAASASETAAAASESAAATSESNAATSASNASTSETNAANSASAASTSETNAAASESAAATSASNASTSESNAATSASAASTSASNASTSATNAANSASAAATSASEAAASAASINPDNIDINGGTIDGTTIGGTTPAAGTFTQANFADNAKAIFGAGSDLQIYHDGSNSYVKENGVGNFYIQGQNSIRLTNSGGTENYAIFNVDGAVQLNHDNATRLLTTSTGIDVTGTVVADGLTINNTAPYITFKDTDTTDNVTGYLDFRTSADVQKGFVGFNGAGDFELNNLNNNGINFSTTNVKRMDINSIGDISFYEDTGTTAKFFWDASAESLGIGNTAPESKLDIGTTSDSAAVLASFRANGFTTRLEHIGVGSHLYTGGSSAYLALGTNSTDRLTITSNGLVGIGTDSPTDKLTVAGNVVISTAAAFRVTGSDSTSSQAVFRAYRGGAGDQTGGYAGLRTVGDGANGVAAFLFDVGTSEKMRIDSSGNVGIGTSSPDVALDVVGEAIIGNGTYGVKLSYSVGDTAGIIDTGNSANKISFRIGNSEKAKIDSSGNLLVGKTVSSFSVAGIGLLANNQILATATSDNALALNRLTTDGDIARFYKDSVKVGSIGVKSSLPYFIRTTGGIIIGNTALSACDGNGDTADNVSDLGALNVRWDDVYATNGTIQTSDRNEKQDIEVLSEAEARVAVACKGLLRKFRWKDAVAEKGDEARIHFGIIAQDLQDAFAAEGLDAGRYAMFISSTWWETQTEVPAVEADEENGIEAKEAYTRTDTYETAEEAPEGAIERTRMGVRYPELLAFIIAAI